MALVLLLMLAFIGCAWPLQIWAPGNALALNVHQASKEFAYIYPLWLPHSFTLEAWMLGGSTHPLVPTYFGVVSPAISDGVLWHSGGATSLLGAGFGEPLTPQCEGWCHHAVSVQLALTPDGRGAMYNISRYLNGVLQYQRNSGTVADTPLASIWNDDVSIVFGFGVKMLADSLRFDYLPLPAGHFFSGHIDEIRFWDTARSAADIARDYTSRLSQPTPGLLLCYSFDPPAGAQDHMNRTRLYVADGDDHNRTALTTTSTAPVCSEAQRAHIRLQSGDTAKIPVQSLYCGDHGTVQVTVQVVRGGVLQLDGRPVALRESLAGPHILRFVATAGPLPADAGFDYTVQDASGAPPMRGAVVVLENHPPVLSPVHVQGDEDTTAIAPWLPAADPDHDLVRVEIWTPPAHGNATTDDGIRRSVLFHPPPHRCGPNVSSFRVRGRDMWGAYSEAVEVSVSLECVVDQPDLTLPLEYTIYDGQRLQLPYRVAEHDGRRPFVVVTTVPPPSEATLMVQDGPREWVVQPQLPHQVDQWAQNVTRFSSQFAWDVGEMPWWHAVQVIGPPETDGAQGPTDSEHSWAPRTTDGGCVRRTLAGDPHAPFFTEFLELSFRQPVYAHHVAVVENLGGGRIVRVLVPSNRDARWTTVWRREANHAGDHPNKYTVFDASICQVHWLVDRLRLEFDTCRTGSWYMVDAVQLTGSVTPLTHVFDATADLYLTAKPGFAGTIGVALTATTCYGDYHSTSKQQEVQVHVVPPPYMLTHQADKSWIAIDVFAACNGSVLQPDVQVLRVPEKGELRHHGVVIDRAPWQAPHATGALFEYRIGRCNEDDDAFNVQLNRTVVVRVVLKGCQETTKLTVVSVVGGAVCCLLGIALLWLWFRRRNNSAAPKDPSRAVSVVFTDVQASTALWATLPEVMPGALVKHHRVMRDLIKKYKCYEVKTIGDSFMVVTQSCVDAARMSLSIQEALHAVDWETDAINRFYSPLAEEASHSLWNGLRVRIGVHHGRCNIVPDVVSKGYDYYGDTVNTAARIESKAHGGEILVSADFYHAVQNKLQEDSYRFMSTSLGFFHLPGLATDIELFRLLPLQFGGRQFDSVSQEIVEDYKRQITDIIQNCPSASHGMLISQMNLPGQLMAGA